MLRARLLRPRVIFVVVALCAGLALTAAHRDDSPRLSYGHSVAIVQHNRAAARLLSGLAYNRVTVTRIDTGLERVTFLDHGQVQAEFALNRDFHVVATDDFANRRVPYGNWLAFEPAVLLALTLLFAAVTLVRPWRCWRNADVVAICSLLAPLVLLQHRYVHDSVLSALPGLLYLLGRCAWTALRGAEPVAAPLVDLGARPDARRLLGALLATLGLVYFMVSVSTGSPVDVIYAVMEGATKLIHGVMPYGHLPGDVVHGDTYPPLSYLLYTPLAALAPVGSVWDSVDLALAITAAIAVSVALALGRMGGRAPSRFDPRPALAWLAFPTLLVTTSSGTTDVALAAMLLAAFALRRRSTLAAGVLGVAGWFKLAPFILVPLWLAPLRGRALGRALGAIAAVSAAVLGVVIALGGPGALRAMVHAVGYQFTRGSEQSFGQVLGLTALQPVGQALVFAAVAAGTASIARDPGAFGVRRLAALVVVVLIGLQLTANYWSVLYLAWLAPVLILALLGVPVAEPASRAVPALTDPRQAAPVPA